jgi:hypothetical protein
MYLSIAQTIAAGRGNDLRKQAAATRRARQARHARRTVISGC